MLTHLSVTNFALIDNLEIDLPSGLTIITGETGAGKSILLGALGLIIGQRADTAALQDKTKKCIVEGAFKISDYKLQHFFKTNEIDYADETIIRREISPEGKSRAFVNDTPVNLSVLKELGVSLIDIHSQHETLTLNDSSFQLSLVDIFASNQSLLNSYSTSFLIYSAKKNELKELLDSEAKAKKDADYFQFQFNELDEIDLKGLDQQAMEQELETLNNAEEIKTTIAKAYQALQGGEQTIVSLLNQVKTEVTAMAKYNAAVKNLAERLASSVIELKDISNDLDDVEQSINHDAKRIEELTSKLDILYRLQKKHNVSSVSELIEIKENLSNQLLAIHSLDSDIAKLKAEISKLEAVLKKQAEELSTKRKKASPAIEKEIGVLLADLGMPNAILKIKLEPLAGELFNSTGIDKIQFLFSANKGADFKELHKVASGGELSRLMLSLKSLIAQLTSLPAIIFDEIDTGVSGDVADKVGLIMQRMAKQMQVISITHLPQIASKGSSHLFVYKEEKAGKTYSRIKKIEKEERILEIAKMLSTQNPTDAAIKNAKELLTTKN